MTGTRSYGTYVHFVRHLLKSPLNQLRPRVSFTVISMINQPPPAYLRTSFPTWTSPDPQAARPALPVLVHQPTMVPIDHLRVDLFHHESSSQTHLFLSPFGPQAQPSFKFFPWTGRRDPDSETQSSTPNRFSCRLAEQDCYLTCQAMLSSFADSTMQGCEL